jgi:hypothetical protein
MANGRLTPAVRHKVLDSAARRSHKMEGEQRRLSSRFRAGMNVGGRPVVTAIPRGGAAEPRQYERPWAGRVEIAKGAVAMIYGEPETPRFLAALQRLKRAQRKKARQTRQAKQRVRATLRKMREC